MPAAAPPATPIAQPPPTTPDAFLSGLGGQALLFAELSGGPGLAPLARVERAMRGWAKRRWFSPPLRWPLLFWRSLLRQLDDAPDAEPAAANADLTHALRALPPMQRRAFLLRVWLGFELPLVAELLGVDDEATARLLVTALQQMRTQLGMAPADQRWVLHARAALELRAGTLALSRQPALAAARARALARPRRRWLLLPVAAAAVLLGLLWLPPPAPPLLPVPSADAERSLDSGIAVAAEPLEQLLSLPADDFALLADPVAFELLAELEFQLWRLEQDTDAR
jgi:hypothetical protein